jgi:cobyrinic acid a,c-diamide synthase
VTVPGILVAGLRGGSGKTLLSLGLAASLRKRNLIVAPFKKGPDYIDASWLSLAAGRPCRNLDLFLLTPSAVLRSFEQANRGADLALVEGNRGLFDGVDAEGTFSSAELAKLLGIPVLLSVDVTKTTRTAAAQVLGCQAMDPDVSLKGVVLNRTAGSRHESVLRQAIEGTCGIPVLGAVPRLPDDLFPERHLGLVPPQETVEAHAPLERAAEVARSHLDVDAILAMAREHTRPTPQVDLAEEVSVLHAPPSHQPPDRPRIGVFRDAAFQFYYPENLEALEAAGATLVEVSPLDDRQIPGVDALYLGGGFPETLAVGLSGNAPFMKSVREAAEGGLPIYAECGGAIYLGEKLHYGGRVFPLAGVLPVEYGFQPRPKGHGYTVVETVRENAFFAVGQGLKGHEFHYSFLLSPDSGALAFAFRVHRGFGFTGQHDGMVRNNVLACYTHVHALGTEVWAPAVVGAAARFRQGLEP